MRWSRARVAHLTGYQNAALGAALSTRCVRGLQRREAALAGADASLPLSRAVAAQSLLKLMSYKDEYEVARLYTDGEFRARAGRAVRRRLRARIPHGAAAARDGRRTDGAPRKIRLGAWLLPVLKVLARAARRCAARAFDPFGRTEERRARARARSTQYEARRATNWSEA